ncbi:response regulator transcription factor [Pseudonocardia spinosispora]|uniref:response regulator transcription factor n=1 Tax=Pseudonocardia spinosispora TaxID=103441 RepID=UPI0004908EF2|nr:response regulator transcription factor [Pseudonocardia spinosispora]
MGNSALLVEDDVRIREALTLGLIDEDIRVVPAVSGEEALALVEKSDVQVVLLDLMLPGIDGLAVCEQLRAKGDLPIIIITARSGTADVIKGLEAGADDYVTKPLVASELAARIRALLRRSAPRGPSTETELVSGDVEMLPERGVVRKDGTEVHLTRTEFRLLHEILGANGRVVTREELLQRVWGYDYFGDTRLLDVHIRRLRRKVESHPDAPSVVLTVRGVGYKASP